MKDGRLIDSPAPGRYYSVDPTARTDLTKFYLPENLPPELDIALESEISDAYGGAMHALGRLEGFWSEVEDPEKVFGLFVYKEAEQSSQVEGTEVTVSDMYRKAADSKDVREAQNYVKALQAATDQLVENGRSRQNLSIDLLKSMHETLMEGGRTDESDPLPGEFRNTYVHIEEKEETDYGRGVRFVPPKASTAHHKMQRLEEYIQSDGKYPDLIDIALIHYQIETIHPFVDGNGRVGRLLIALMLVATRILVHPLFYLSSYIRQHRSEYTDCLLAVSEENEWEEWIEFFLTGLKEQADEAFSRSKMLLELREKYRERFEGSTPTVRALIELLFTNPVLTTGDIEDKLGVMNQTANNAAKTLQSAGVLIETTGQVRYQEFDAAEVLAVLNRSPDELPAPSELMTSVGPQL